VFQCQLFKKEKKKGKTSVPQRRTLSKIKRGEWAQTMIIIFERSRNSLE